MKDKVGKKSHKLHKYLKMEKNHLKNILEVNAVCHIL